MAKDDVAMVFCHEIQRKTEVILFLVLATLSFWIGYHEFGSLLVRPDEPLYTQISLEMFQRHQWLVPLLHGKSSFVKPPFLYWLEQVGFVIFGKTLWAARFPVWILGLLSGWLTYQIGLFLQLRQAGWLAAIFLLSSVTFFQYSQTDMMDVPLTFFILFSFWAYIMALQKNKRWLFFSAVILGFSSLVKGPVGIVLCLIPIALHMVIFESWKRFNRKEFWIAIFLVLLASFWWPFWLWTRGYGESWFREFILGENFGKFAGENMSFGILLIGLLGGLFPWTFLFLESLVKGIVEIKISSGTRFALGWVLIVLLVFALPMRKLPHYSVPILPAATLLMVQSKDFSKFSRGITGIMLGFVGFFCFLGVRLTVFPMVKACFIIAGIAAFCSGFFLQLKGRLAYSIVFFGMVLMLLPIILPGVELLGQQKIVHELESTGLPVGVYCPNDQEPRGFELSPKFLSFENSPEAVRFLKQGGILISSERSVPSFKSLPVSVRVKWNVWRPGLGLGKVIHALFTGHAEPLQEEMLAISL